MRIAIAALLVGACHGAPILDDVDTDGSCPAVGSLADAPPCVSGACPELVEPSCDEPDVSWQFCSTTNGTRYTVVLDAAAPPTRTFYDAVGAVVAVEVTGSFGEGCPSTRWFGQRLDDCLVTGTREPDCPHTGDTDPGDTDAAHTDSGDTDVPPIPDTAFFTPLEAAPVCFAAAPGVPAYCPELSSFALCAQPELVFAAEGTCTLSGRRLEVKRWVHGSGPTVLTSTVYDDVSLSGWTSGPIVAYAERAPGQPRKWWGDDLTGCDAQINAFMPVDCTPPDTDPPVDSDTDPVDTAAGLDTDDGWPIAWTDPGSLAITELMVDPSGCTDSFGELIELLNVGDRDIDLHGLVLRTIAPADTGDAETTSRILEHHRLEPGAYAIAMPAHARVGCMSLDVVADVTYGVTQPDALQLFDEGAVLTIERRDRTVIDRVDFTGWRFDPPYVAPAGRTLQLRPGHEHDTDDDTDGADWCLGVDPIPDATPGDSDGPQNFGSPGLPTTCAP